ncbi:DUF397 domain-containing protein [Streptomyces sp. HC307]|uniref:DUF397 domain-containing protein n=1 Tax=Streptomyces flavusporus TaxID=3385496 RepID=UPI0039175CBC
MTQALHWQKSTYSGGAEGNTCVEIAKLPIRIAIRDSKRPTHATLTFATETFTAFLDSLKPDAR